MQCLAVAWIEGSSRIVRELISLFLRLLLDLLLQELVRIILPRVEGESVRLLVLELVPCDLAILLDLLPCFFLLLR